MTPAVASVSDFRSSHSGAENGAGRAGFTAPPGSAAVAVADPTGMRQVPVSESALSSKPRRLLTRKRPVEVKPTVALPSAKKPADRTVQIADFTWTLPLDPGEDGPYPSLIFLIGAAISSGENGEMKLADIYQWLRARYPSRRQFSKNSLANLLGKGADFTRLKTGIYVGNASWKLRNPQVFGSHFEKDIFRRRTGIVLERAYKNARSAAGQGGAASLLPESPLLGQPAPPGADGEASLAPALPAPALPVTIGCHILTLPPCRPGQQRPPLKLLCGCAIALGSEQGSSASEIAEWIAGRYPIQGESAMKVLRVNTGVTLSHSNNDFRRTDIRQHVKLAKQRSEMKWVLKNPYVFAAGCKGGLYRWGYFSVVPKRQDLSLSLSAIDQDSSVANSQNR